MKLGLDTNIFISIKNKETFSSESKLILAAIEKNHWDCVISVIVVSEMLVGYYKLGNLSDADQFLLMAEQFYHIQPVNLEIAQLTAQYRAKYNIRLPDALIIATGVYNKVDVIISNDLPVIKKFPMIIQTPQEFVQKHLTPA